MRAKYPPEGYLPQLFDWRTIFFAFAIAVRFRRSYIHNAEGCILTCSLSVPGFASGALTQGWIALAIQLFCAIFQSRFAWNVRGRALVCSPARARPPQRCVRFFQASRMRIPSLVRTREEVRILWYNYNTSFGILMVGMKTTLQNCPYLSVSVRICPRRVEKKLDKYFSSVKIFLQSQTEKKFSCLTRKFTH